MILVTGSTSQVGIVLLRELAKMGRKVRCLVRENSNIKGIEGLDVEFVYGDIEDKESLKKAVAEAEYIVHIAGIWRAQMVLDACKDSRCLKKVIFVGSTSRFKKLDSIDETERALAQKMAKAEEIINRSSIHTVILRPTMLYGLDKDKNILQIISVMNRFHMYPLIGKGNALKHPIYVGDVANAIILSLQNEKVTKGDYIIAGKEPIVYRHMLDNIRKTLGKRVILVSIPIWAASLLLRVYNLMHRKSYINQAMIQRVNEDIQYDITPAVRDLGFHPVSFQEGIKRQMQYLTQNGYFKR